MAKSKNILPGLARATNKRSGSLAGAPGLVNTATPTGGSLRLGSNRGTQASGLGAPDTAQGITFGKPPAQKNTSTPGSDWAQLVDQAANSSAMSLLGGGLNLTGIGSVISTFTSLFRHQKTLPALTPFQMAPSQNEAITIGGGVTTTSTQSIQDQSAQIAQAVKTAILSSSTLNDVLAEI
jgi:hypothetical protein